MFNPKRSLSRDERNLRDRRPCRARAAATIVLWSTATFVYGSDWFFQPEVAAGVGYEENVDLVDEDPFNATRYDLEAMARGGRITERSQVLGNLSAVFQRYPGNERLDSDNLSAGLNSAILLTELDRLSLDLSYVRDTSRRSELTTTGNIIENVPRNAIRIQPAWQHQLTERSAVGLAFTHARVRFDSNLSGLIDYDQNDIDAFYNYQLTERLAFRGTIGVVSYDPDDVESYKGYDASLGLNYLFSETLMGELFVGPQRVDSQIDLGAETISRTASGISYGFNLSKQFERSGLDLSLSRGAVPTGSGEPLLQERLSLAYSYQFSPRLSVIVPAAVFRNETISFGGAAETENEMRIFFSMQPSIEWRVTEDLVMNASYRYRYQRFEQEGSSADSNALFVTLSYVWPTEIPSLSQ